MKISSSYRLLASVLLATTVSTQAFAKGDNDHQGGRGQENQAAKQANQMAKQQQQQAKQQQQQGQQQQQQAQQQQRQAQQQQRQQQNQFKQAQQQQQQAQQQQRQQQDQARQAQEQQQRARQQQKDNERQQKSAQQQQKLIQNQQQNARENRQNDIRQAQNKQALEAHRESNKARDRNWNNNKNNSWNKNNNRPNSNFQGSWKNGRWYGDRNHVRKATNKKFKDWNAQRSYLNQNIRRMNEIARLNAVQQQQLDAQMRAAYLAYHNNNWNGAYDWNAYSDPQFIDYIEETRPSLLGTIMGYLGLGNSGNVGYLNTNSSDWNSERNDFAQNINRIHQMRLEGRISAEQEQVLLSQLQAEFRAYRGNNFSGDNSWNNYNDPGFMDYLHNRKPSVLNTIRGFLNL